MTAKASSRCPICGIDTPHEHDGATVKAYRDEQLYWGNKMLEEASRKDALRKDVDDKMLEELQRRINSATAAKAAYESECPCCRIAMWDNLIKATIGTLIVYDYGWDQEGADLVRCHKCGRTIWDRT